MARDGVKYPKPEVIQAMVKRSEARIRHALDSDPVFAATFRAQLKNLNDHLATAQMRSTMVTWGVTEEDVGASRELQLQLIDAVNESIRWVQVHP